MFDLYLYVLLYVYVGMRFQRRIGRGGYAVSAENWAGGVCGFSVEIGSDEQGPCGRN